MVNGKKVIMSICVLMMVMCFCVVSSYSQEKPSEENMKGIIKTIELHDKLKSIDLSAIKFDSFQITNSMVSLNSDGKTSHYYIDVNYKISYFLNTNKYDKNRDRINSLNKTIKDEKQRIAILVNKIKFKQFEGNTEYNMTAEIKDRESNINNLNKMINDISRLPDVIKDKKYIVRNDYKLYFVKKGDKWYGGTGW